jgi:hypothetical protein
MKQIWYVSLESSYVITAIRLDQLWISNSEVLSNISFSLTFSVIQFRSAIKYCTRLSRKSYKIFLFPWQSVLFISSLQSAQLVLVLSTGKWMGFMHTVHIVHGTCWFTLPWNYLSWVIIGTLVDDNYLQFFMCIVQCSLKLLNVDLVILIWHYTPRKFLYVCVFILLLSQ